MSVPRDRHLQIATAVPYEQQNLSQGCELSQDPKSLSFIATMVSPVGCDSPTCHTTCLGAGCQYTDIIQLREHVSTAFRIVCFPAPALSRLSSQLSNSVSDERVVSTPTLQTCDGTFPLSITLFAPNDWRGVYVMHLICRASLGHRESYSEEASYYDRAAVLMSHATVH